MGKTRFEECFHVFLDDTSFLFLTNLFQLSALQEKHLRNLDVQECLQQLRGQ